MMRDELTLPILYSIATHLVVILAFTVKAVFFPEQIELMEPALRVDIVDLPDKISPMEPPTPASPPQEAAKPQEQVKKTLPPVTKEEDLTPAVVLKTLKDKKKPQEEIRNSAADDAIKKLKKQLAIEKIKDEIKAQQRQELNSKVQKFKGNVLAAGTELTGVNKLQHESYLTQLDHHVKRYWHLPEWLARRSYRAQVRIFLDEQGMLTQSQLVLRSGNDDYDDMVLETVKKASPFPSPPEKFKDIVGITGMVLGFPE